MSFKSEPPKIGLANFIELTPDGDLTYLSSPYDDSGNKGLLIEVGTDIIYENHIERLSEVSKQKIDL